MKKAMVIGATGQDGSYLTELLIGKGYAVLGTTRSAGPPSSLQVQPTEWMNWDLRDQKVLQAAFERFGPDEVYNVAAYSPGIGMFDRPVDMGDINGLAISRMLEAIRRSGRPIKFCQASSSEIFGAAASSPQSEQTPVKPRSPYGAAKLYADSMVRVFREAHGVFACSAILFNHESPRRSPSFVTGKVARAAARIKLGLQDELVLETLASRRDWGHARDAVEGMWLMLQHSHADDYIIATGKTHSVAELCEVAFGVVGLPAEEYVQTGQRVFRAAEGAVELVGDASKARRVLGWAPTVSFQAMITEMVGAELLLAQREKRSAV